MMENRRQVLDMLAQGKITADEAERLLSLVDQPPEAAAGSREAGESGKPAPKYLRVVINDGGGSHSEHVNIRVPMGLIRAGVKLASVLPSNATEKIKAGDLGELVSSLSELEVDIHDGDKKIRIYVE